MTDLVQEVSKKAGRMTRVARKATYNPKTKQFYGFPEGYAPDPVQYRRSFLQEAGVSLNTWDDLRKGAAKLKQIGHPVGLGMSNEIDSNMLLTSLLYCYGGFIQNEENRIVIGQGSNRRGAIQALQVMKEIYASGMPTFHVPASTISWMWRSPARLQRTYASSRPSPCSSTSQPIMVLFIAGVQKIPTSLYDAARVDGAGAVREFFAVTLPGLHNEILVAFVLTTINALRSFDIVYNTTAGGPGGETLVPSMYMYQNAFLYNRVGYAAAIATVLAIAIFILAAVMLRVGDRDEER